MPLTPIEQSFQLAVQHHQAGRLSQAEIVYREILAQHPAHAGAMIYLGLLAHQVGRNNVALELIQKALTLEPGNPEGHSNLGNVLAGLGRLDEAVAAFHRALALKPQSPRIYYNLGNVLIEQRMFEEAISAFRQSIALNPSFPEAHQNLGVALRGSGRTLEAADAFRQAIAVKPGFAEGHINLGIAFAELRQWDEAIGAYWQALSINPRSPEAYSNLGNALKETGQTDEAIAAYQKSTTLKPDYVDGWRNLAAVLNDTGRLDESIAACRQVISLVPKSSPAYSNLLYTIHYHPEYDSAKIAEEHRPWYARCVEPLESLIEPHTNNRDPDRRLKIGYVSPDFRIHPVGRFMLPLMAHHDKSRFEIYGYFNAANSDAMTERLRSFTDQWTDITNLSDEKATELIHQDQIDILVDLSMHTSRNRLLIFARKPAPVQVTYLAYCSTTGLKAINYRLSDPFVDRPEDDLSNYIEQTVHLPATGWCYEPVEDDLAVSPLPASAAGRVTFGCLNNFNKVNESVLAVWAQILASVPDSQVILYACQGSHRDRLMDRMEQAGIARSRISFVGRMLTRDYFERYSRIDIALDPFPYGGGTTTCDALWMGVPVVSLIGRTGVGRAGLSILSNIGLPEFAAGSEEDYVRIAVELANDPKRVADLRSTLRQKMQQSPLMDAPKFTKDVEQAFRGMWKNWCERASRG